LDKEEYIIVADFEQESLYQLKLDSDEVRAIWFKPCQPMSVVFFESINGVYLLCYHVDEKRYIILRKSFINRSSKTIYSGTLGTGIFSWLLLTGLY